MRQQRTREDVLMRALAQEQARNDLLSARILQLEKDLAEKKPNKTNNSRIKSAKEKK